jgi:hypothetical protein
MMTAHWAATGWESQRTDPRIQPQKFNKRPEDLIERARIDVDHGEIVAHDHRDHHHRDEKNGDVEPAAPELLVHEHREHKAHEQLEGDRHPGEIERSPQGPPEIGLREDHREVQEAVEVGHLEGPVGAPLQQTDVDRKDEGNGQETEERRLHHHERDEAEDALLGEPRGHAVPEARPVSHLFSRRLYR